MASIRPLRKKKNGQWSASIEFYDADRVPKRKIQTLSHSSKTTVLKLAEHAVEKYEDGELDPWTQKIKISSVRNTDARSRTFADIVEEYIEYKSKYDWGEYVAQNNAIMLRSWCQKLGLNRTIHEITSSEIEEIINAPAGSASRASYHRLFNTFNNWIHERDIVKNKFTVQLEKKPTYTQIKYITEDEVRIIQQTIVRYNKRNIERGYWYPNHNTLYLVRVVRFLFITGLRLSEMLELRLGDINTDTGVFYIRGKSQQTESLPYSSIPALERIIHAQIRDLPTTDPTIRLFQRKSRHNLTRYIKKFIRLALPEDRAEALCAHGLRHGAATYLLNQGLPLKVVKEWLRHRKISTTERYAKLLQSELGKRVGKVHK